MNVLAKLFTPAGKKFYDLFERVAVNLGHMADHFVAYIPISNRPERKSILDKIELLENKNDEVTHRLFVELGRNFITPLDREDIHYMASSLDDIADFIWATSKQMYYFDIWGQNDPTVIVADNLVHYVGHLKIAISRMSEHKGVHMQTETLETMRGIVITSDSIISRALGGVFKVGAETVETIKLSDHYNMLLNLNKRCGDVINVLEAMIIKYA